jgi:competence protein ComEC
MRLAGLLFVFGTLSGLLCGPPRAVALWVVACVVPWLLRPRLWPLSLLLWGYLWAVWAIHRAEHELLPLALEDESQVVGARVASFPMPAKTGYVIELAGSEARGAAVRGLPERLRVSWRDAPSSLGLGDWCELHVRLRRPHGLANPGSIDVERAALVRHLGASGYVIPHPGNHCAPIATRMQLDGLRAWLARRIEQAVVDPTAGAAIKALAIDDRSALSSAQWDVMRRTGTAHLLAISGLQISLAAGWCFVLCRWLLGFLWAWRQDYLVLHAAWIASVFAAWAYTLVAGAGLPSVRAAVMVGIAAGAALCGRRALSWDTFLTSLVVLVAWDPMCLLGSGLWLSFGAVAVLIVMASGRERIHPLRLAWRTHVVMACALAPLTAALFGEVSWCAPLANLLAVPWANIFVVPLILLGMLCAAWAPMVAALLWDCAARLWAPLEHWLGWMAAAPPWVLHHALGVAGTALLSGALLLLVMPRAVPGRTLGLLLLAIVAIPRERPLHKGEFRITQFDVGQGLAVLVRTRDYALLYDTGPRWWEGGDAGERVVLPALRALGIARLDTLLISHTDLDHAGGAASILSQLPVARVLSGEPLQLPGGFVAQACRAPLSWQVDGVRFEIVHPHAGASFVKRNDRSCVLTVQGDYGRALLSGDIEHGAEQALLARDPALLAADVITVPHHGSASSSSAGFVQAVQPQVALIAAGLHNRYQLPHRAVVARYHAAGAVVISSASSGATSVDVAQRGLRVERYRAAHWGWWQQRLR